MSLTKIGSIGINTGIQFAGITTVSTLKVGSGVTVSSDGDGFFTGVTTATTFVGALTGNVTGNISGGTVAGSTGTFTGDVSIANKLVHTGDTDTFLSFPNNNEIEFKVADQQAIKFTTTSIETGDNKRIDIIDASGDRSGEIKNSDSGANSLMISADPDNSGSSTVMLFSVDGSEKLRITSDGKIGVNENSPSQKLHVGGDGYFGFATPTDAARQIIFNVNRGSAADTLANINWQWNSKNVAQIRGVAGADTTNKDDGHLTFHTSSANNLTERLRIDSSGRLLLGTTDIGYDSFADNLTIADSANCGITLRSGTSNQGNIYFSDGTGTGEDTYRGYITYAHGSSNHMQFATNAVERLRITSAGDLSLRTTTQNAFLGLTASSTAINFTLGSTTGTSPRMYFYGTGNGQSSAGDIFMGAGNGGIIHFRSAESIKLEVNSDSSTKEALRIDTSGNIGVGVVPKTGQYSGYNHIQVGESGTLSSNDTQGDTNVTSLTNNVYLDATASNWKYLHTDEATRYQQYNGQHHFSVAASGSADANVSFSNILRIDSDGIKFNGDSSAANGLDDYEEGTWTPSIRGGGGSITSTYVALYTKVGRIVHLQTYLQFDASGTNTNAFQIQGLPFAALTHGYFAQIVDFGRGGIKGAYSRTNAGNVWVDFLYSSEGTTSDRITIKGNQVGSGYIIFSCTYMTS